MLKFRFQISALGLRNPAKVIATYSIYKIKLTCDCGVRRFCVWRKCWTTRRSAAVAHASSVADASSTVIELWIELTNRLFVCYRNLLPNTGILSHFVFYRSLPYLNTSAVIYRSVILTHGTSTVYRNQLYRWNDCPYSTPFRDSFYCTQSFNFYLSGPSLHWLANFIFIISL